MDMSWIETSLTRIERQLRELIEGDPPAEGIPVRLHHQLEKELAAAMRTTVQAIPSKNSDGSQPAIPDEYTIIVSPQSAELLLTHPKELDILAQHVKDASARLGFRAASAPIVRVVADPNTEGLQVIAGYSQAMHINTHTAIVDGGSTNGNGALEEASPTGFLIVNGLATYLLTRKVSNLGRDAGNHIQVDDPRVSRFHAQIRLIHGRFVIFDLDSSGGTFVNGIAITSQILNPGDVILLAGVPLVYGQEQGVQDGYTQEVPADHQ